MEPSFIRKEREKFRNVKKNKILSEEVVLDELKGKIGTFIIEF